MKKVFTLLFASIILVSLVGCSKTTQTTIPTTSTISITTTTVGATGTTITSPPKEAPISIDKSSDGQTVRANLVKFTGGIPSADATILVNNNSVKVDSSGNYYIYLDLNKGQNVIEVKTITGTETKTENIHIFFKLPLAIQVRLNKSNFDPNTDFKSPIEAIDGVVSDPAAEVKVNGVKVDVNTDGTFMARILLLIGGNHVDATAQLGNEADEEYLNWNIADNGQLKTISGFLTVPNILPTVTLNAGESTSFDFSLEFDKKIPDFSLNSLSITRIATLSGGNNSLPMLPELKVSINPSTYSTYPRIAYDSRVTIETTTALPPGDYYFNISSSLGNGAVFTSGTYYSVIDVNQLSDTPKGANFEVIIN
jgi:nitrogen fixation protein FixH